MTLFDIVAGLILCVSALIGFARGAVKELVGLFAFILAAMASVFLLPFSGRLARHLAHPAWAASAAAVIVVFVIAYIALRVLGASVSSALRRQATLGMMDRGVGFGFGVVRALVAFGMFFLAFNAVTPPDLQPAWITRSAFYPVSRTSGRMLASIAPPGLKAMGGLGRALKARASEGLAPDVNEDTEDARPADAPPPPPPSHHRHHRSPATEAGSLQAE